MEREDEVGTGGLVALRVDAPVREEMPVPLERRLRRRCQRMLRAVGLCDVELSVLLAGDDRLAELNRAWRRKRGPTDVLSFPGTTDSATLRTWRAPRAKKTDVGPERTLGDLVLSLHTVRRRSPASQAYEADLVDLLAHGILHLLGHDHPTKASREAMLDLQARLVSVATGRGPVRPVVVF